jgi:hypothetical protein
MSIDENLKIHLFYILDNLESRGRTIYSFSSVRCQVYVIRYIIGRNWTFLEVNGSKRK